MATRTNNASRIFIRGLGLVETTPEHKREHERECARIRMKMLYHNECRCTRGSINRCDGECVGCPYRASGRFVSTETPLADDESLTLGDTLQASPADQPEVILAKKVLRQELACAIASCTPEERRILAAVAQGTSERQMAGDLGISRTTLNYRKRKLLGRIAEEHPDLADLLSL